MRHKPTKFLLAASVYLLLSAGSYIAVGRHPRATGAEASSAARATTKLTKASAHARSDTPVRQSIGTAVRNPSEIITTLTDGVSDWRKFTPKNLVVQLTLDIALPFHVTKVEQVNGRTVLTARISKADPNESNGLDSAFFVSTSNASDRFEAIVVLPGEEYQIHVGPTGSSVVQVLQTDWRCAADAIQPHEMEAKPNARPAADMLPADSTAPAVRVLFLTSADTLAFRDLPTLDALCSNYIAAGNAALQNSQVTNFQWAYTAVIAAPDYTTATHDHPITGDTRTGSYKWIMDDFNQLVNNTSTLCVFARQKRAEYNAGQAVLCVGERSDYGGVAECPGHNCVVLFPTNGFPMDAIANTVIHELGHNFGCHHDRATDHATDGNGQHYYGYVFNDQSDPRYPTGTMTGTIMSYTAPHCLSYSNPDVTYHGYATGVAIGQPTAANNAKVLIDAAPATIASQTSSAPVITQEPQSVTVTSGNSFTLSVTVSGSGTITYQWSKGGQSIARATSSSYSITSALTGDAGQYTVTATNAIGSTTSSAAIVTVNAAPTNQTPPASQGSTGSPSGGGGGGAMAPWFCLGFALLMLLRSMANRTAERTA